MHPKYNAKTSKNNTSTSKLSDIRKLIADKLTYDGDGEADPSQSTPSSDPKKQRIIRACDKCREKQHKGHTLGDASKRRLLPLMTLKEIRNFAPEGKANGINVNWRWSRRACDRCRLKRRLCTVKMPCERCFNKRVECTYKVLVHNHHPTILRSLVCIESGPSEYGGRLPTHQGPDMEALQLANRYANQETPPLKFLHKAWHRLAQTHGENMHPFLTGWNSTFHFVHRHTVEAWLDMVQFNSSTGKELSHDISHRRATVTLITMTLSTIYRDKWFKEPKRGEPKAWTWTTDMGDCLFTTASELLDADYALGTTLQMITVLGCHRRLGHNRGLGRDVLKSPDYAKIQCERRTFWSAYIIDKQLGMMFGRPSHLNANTVDQDLPNCLVDKIYLDVYSFREISETDRLASARRYIKELETWKACLPWLLSHLRVTMLLPIFRRHSTLLKIAHHHAQILVLRPFLTSPYPRGTKQEKRAYHDIIRGLVEAYRFIFVTFNGMQRDLDQSHFHALWYPSQVAYCAIAIMWMLSHIRERQRDICTNEYSPGRKWAVILEELRVETARQVPVFEDPPEQALAYALRAHWEADINPSNTATDEPPIPFAPPRLCDEWKMTDWIDLDAAASSFQAFGPIMDFSDPLEE
ncbi:hypothetical protein B0T17DRAFT_586197 [Bombardia bombarda]|uniref:Zn(2)-C6 fungal-type domain-containing protein n=1 Tax=Bombardia bombarda TaxID=252184 RepID=A0AA39XI51_9PEZI|nr:hypothetical protein B0T17DRAFT_586197 [Bombardia bombarda]